MNRSQYEQRFDEVERMVATLLPEFVQAVGSSTDVIVLHQDSFAADLQDDELALLGAAIKVAGRRGKQVQIIGTAGETFTRPK